MCRIILAISIIFIASGAHWHVMYRFHLSFLFIPPLPIVNLLVPWIFCVYANFHVILKLSWIKSCKFFWDMAFLICWAFATIVWKLTSDFWLLLWNWLVWYPFTWLVICRQCLGHTSLTRREKANMVMYLIMLLLDAIMLCVFHIYYFIFSFYLV